jgi:diguanylate cyclase (GGDEF)-like protein
MLSTPALTEARQRVLLIEDDLADATLVQRSLERFPGFAFVHVERMDGALDLLDRERFDIALLDLSLPDSFGLDGITTLHARHAHLPVVVLTGLDDKVLALRALEFGAQDYLNKGECSAELLIRTLRYAIQRQQIQSENERLLAELTRQARHDSLTGIYNRRSLVAELAREWQRAERTAEPLSIVLLDIDFFKRINDTYGHAAGDQVLQTLADVLKSGCRGTDLPGRYGGEEFLIIVPGACEEGAAAWADRLRQDLLATKMLIGDETVHVTASFGVAAKGSELAAWEQLVERADESLRLAKHLGRDRVVTFRELTAHAAADCGDNPLASVSAADIMSPLVASLSDAATLQEVTQFLLDLRLDSVPLVDEQGRLSGIIGEEDITQALAGQHDWHAPVHQFMRKRPAGFAPDAPAAVIQEFLSRTGSRRVLIVEQGRAVGVVSRASLLRWRENQAHANRSLLAELSGRTTSAPASLEHLVELMAEVEQQAASIKSGVVISNDGPLLTTIAGATRIQLLLEQSLSLAQHLQVSEPHEMALGMPVN